MNNPGEPMFTPMAQGAQALHEMFLSYVDAGFTRAEAMQLLISLISMQAGNQHPEAT